MELIENDILRTQIDVFFAGLEADETEIASRFQAKSIPFGMLDDLTECLNEQMSNTSCSPSYLSLLQHLTLLPENPSEKYNRF